METPLGPSFANAFLSYYEKKKTGYTVVHKDSNQFFTDVMSTIFLFFSNRMITWSIFKNF